MAGLKTFNLIRPYSQNSRLFSYKFYKINHKFSKSIEVSDNCREAPIWVSQKPVLNPYCARSRRAQNKVRRLHRTHSSGEEEIGA